MHAIKSFYLMNVFYLYLKAFIKSFHILKPISLYQMKMSCQKQTCQFIITKIGLSKEMHRILLFKI
ncbi:hypothetical protein A7P25_24740 [Achromobacter xylosoxidans]|nr:hypothetical protein A7P25_24740 [Achromobacter xylosoxidans]